MSTDNFSTFAPGWQNALISFQNPVNGQASWAILGLSPSTAYKVRLRAVNADGSSPNSEPISVTTAAHPAMVSSNLWANSFGASGNNTWVTSMASDIDGNVYAVGFFGGSITLGTTTLTSVGNGDVYFAKYNAAGVVQWAKSIGGTGPDEGWQIAVDATGVYISGVFDATVDFNPDGGVNTISTRGAAFNPRFNTLNDGFIAKYNLSNGSFIWAQSLGDAWPEYYTDALATDRNNGVFLTGMFTGTNDFDAGGGTFNLTSAGGPDIFIARFDATNGNFSWAKGMGSANWDAGTGLLTDGDNLYTTGWYYGDMDLDPGAGTVNATGSGTFLNRFLSSNGALIFAKNFTNNGSYVMGYDLAKDNTHIYMVGGFNGSADMDPDGGVQTISGTGGFIAKYALTNGSFAWANVLRATSYMSPSKVIADQAGIYVGGNFAWLADFDPSPGEANLVGNNSDIFIARYNGATGAYQWAKSIGGSGQEDIRSSMALTNDGLYVGGSFQGTVNLDPYTNTLNKTAVDTRDGFIAKYQSVSPPAPAAPVALPATFVSNNGAFVRFSGVQDVTEYRLDISTASNFSSFIPGNQNQLLKTSPAPGQATGFSIFSLSPSTTYYARVRAELPGGLISANSNVVSFTTSAHPVNTSGNLLVNAGGSTLDDQVTALATDASNNIYAVGSYFGNPITFGATTLSNSGGYDGFFVKYNAAGTVQWAKSLSSSANEEIWGVATDATGLYVFGYFNSTLDFDPGAGTSTQTPRGTTINGTQDDSFLAKYSLVDGSLIWAKVLGDAYPITGSPLVSDGSFVYVTGSFYATNDFDPDGGVQNLTSTGLGDAFIARYSASAGAYGWSVGFGSTASDQGYSLLLDGSSLYASGYVGGAADLDPGAGSISGSSGGYFSKFTASTGAILWAKNIVDAASFCFDITKDATHLYVTGQFTDSNADFDFGAGTSTLPKDIGASGFVGKYTLTNGDFVWAKSLLSTNSITPRKIIADASGVYLAGSSTNSGDFDPSANEANRTGYFQDAFLARYASDGSFVWAKTIGSSGTDAIRGGLAVAGDGLYAAGSFQNTVNFDPYTNSVNRTSAGGLDWFISKYTLETILPTAPTANAATNITASGFTANWSSVASASSYRLDVSAVNTFASYLTGFQDRVVNTTAFSVTGLAASTSYFYRVRAVNGAGTSASSGTITATTAATPALAAPVALAATNITGSGFTANWNAVATATSYRLDVTTTDFASFVNGYEDKVITTTSEIVLGLSSSTAYKYRIRAVGAVTSLNSSAISVTTAVPLPLAPLATAPTAITTSGFTANWDVVSGATSYLVYISSDNFQTFLPTYNGKSVSITSEVVTGMTAGASLQYRIKAVNAGGTSSNSNIINVIINLAIPPAPVAATATGITSTTFTANWAASNGATYYLLDVSSNGFVNYLSGYEGKIINALNEPLANLASNTSYQYRLRAGNTAGVSSNSSVITVNTLLTAPLAMAASLITTTGFTANWQALAGATDYRLDVSADNFGTFVTGYNNKTVSATNDIVTGLVANTAYKYRLRAVNANGTSVNSNVMNVTTLPPLPPAPVALAATNISSSGFTANWNASAGATGYQLDISKDNFATYVSGYNSKSLSGTAEVVTGLTGATAYKYRIRAVNISGASASSAAIDVATLLAVPVASAATAISSTGFTANWNASTGATGYQLDISKDNFATFLTGYNSKTLTGTTEIVTGQTDNTAYQYRVRANNGSGTTGNSNIINLTTLSQPPVAPVAIAATSISDAGFTANWNAVTGATGYQLDVSVDNFASFVTGFSSKALATVSGIVTGLSSGTAYKYRVRAVNGGGGVSVNSTEISVTTLAPMAPPVAIAATGITSTGFTANWNAVTGATGYQLDVSADNFASFVTGFNSKALATVSSAVTGLSAGTAYRYRVRAVNGSGTVSVNSNEISATTLAPPVAPVASAASAITSTGFTANWAAVSGATGYRLDVSVDNFATIVTGFSDKTITTLNDAVTGLTANTAYQYRVRAVNANGTSINSNIITVTTAAPAPASPVAIAATTITASGFTANWNTVTGATGYQLDISSDNFSTFLTGYNSKSLTGTIESVTGLTPTTAYSYRVRAVNFNGTSVNSNIITVTTATLPTAPVATAATSVTSSGFTANWNAVAGATSYHLDISADNFSTFLTGYNSKSVTAISETVTGLSAATAYKYRVRTFNANGTSVNSNVIDVTTASLGPPAPVALAATATTGNGFTANWNASTGATGYRLDVSVDNFATMVTGFSDKTVTTTTDAVTGLTGNTAYKYRVRAVNANGTSANSNVVDVTTLSGPAAPVAIAATNISGNGFSANWNAAATAIGYRLDISADNFTTFVAGYNAKSITGTTEAVAGLTPTTGYKYRVRAVNANGTSVNSNVIDVTTLSGPAAPVATVATSVSPSGFVANWNASATATGYQLDISADNFATFITGYNAKSITTLTETVTGLTASIAYKYRVRAVNTNGTSPNSNVIDVTTGAAGTAPAAPVATSATSVSLSGFTANWNAVTGATGYQLDVSGDNFASFLAGYNSKNVGGTTETVTSLIEGKTYKYRVRAVNASGTSANSSAIEATTLSSAKQNQTITFATIADKTLGDAAFALAATASSSLTVSYSTASDKITISGSQITIVKAGRAIITASQSGDATFNAAPTADQSFCIKPAKPTIATATTLDNVTLTSSSPSGNQWFKDGTAITGATNATHVTTLAGVYKVQVSVDNCVSAFSSDLPLIVTGDLANSSSAFELFPNPVGDVLHLKLPWAGTKSIQIIQGDGKTMEKLQTDNREISVNVGHYASGQYFVYVRQGAGIVTGKFIRK